MWGQPKQATSAKAALIYITIGALTVVWTIILYIYLGRNEGSDVSYLMCYGLFFSGLVLIVIGLAVGRIGKSARGAEVAAAPPVVVAPAAEQAAVTGTPPAVVPAAPAAPAAPISAARSDGVR